MADVSDSEWTPPKTRPDADEVTLWSAQDARLEGSLASLARLAAGQLTLEEMLTQVAHFAVLAIPGAEGAGLTLLEEGRPNTIVATGPFVSEIDDIQYGLGQGPCISATDQRRTVISPSLGADQRWPQFGSKTARLGIHSALSLPLLSAEGVVGSMNIYARGKGVFDGRAAELGERYATPAAVAVQNAQVLAQTKRLAEQLHSALATRAVIDRAVGILLSRRGGSAEEAVARLRTLSQHGHQKLHQIAQGIVDEAVRRAEKRHRS